jgi:hypothetical protein
VVEVWRGEAVRLLLDLVRAPSVMEKGAVQEVVERAFRERGLAGDKWEATAAKKLKSRPFKAAC